MTTLSWTGLPIIALLTLTDNGSMSFRELAHHLTITRPETFRDENTLEIALDRYIACLAFESGVVSFNRNARKYTKHSSAERNVQSWLHKAVPDMERWQLYPFRDRRNSKECYLEFPWECIALSEEERRGFQNYPPGCDFRCDGSDSCKHGCGIRID